LSVLLVCVCARVFHVHNIAGASNLFVSKFIRCIFTAGAAAGAGLTRNTWRSNSRQKMQITELITIV